MRVSEGSSEILSLNYCDLNYEWVAAGTFMVLKKNYYGLKFMSSVQAAVEALMLLSPNYSD